MNRELQILVGSDSQGFQIIAFVICPQCSALVWAERLDEHDDWHRTVLRRLP